MAKAQKFKYDVSYTITSTVELKAKKVKSVIADELSYALEALNDGTDTAGTQKAGPVTVTAAE
jgi:hypothetical protein